jgi:hypothetical protein
LQTIADLGRKARDGSISIDEMAGGTFTISNGGVYGSLFGTPIINPPQSAILGMHSIVQVGGRSAPPPASVPRPAPTAGPQKPLPPTAARAGRTAPPDRAAQQQQQPLTRPPRRAGAQNAPPPLPPSAPWSWASPLRPAP